MPDHVYKGIPIEENNVVVTVQPVRGVVANDGLTYRGVLDIDARGNRFVYNQVPNDWREPKRILIDGDGFGLIDGNGNLIMVKR